MANSIFNNIEVQWHFSKQKIVGVPLPPKIEKEPVPLEKIEIPHDILFNFSEKLKE